MQAATAALERSKAQMAEITKAPPATDLPMVAGARAEWVYKRWADLRQAELNLVIARQTVEWLTTKDQAKTAFGRTEALRGLADRAGKR